MKRFLSLICVFLLGITILIPLFPVQKKATAAGTRFNEAELTNKKVLVDKNKDNLSGLLSVHAVENSTPFDSESKAMMSGVAIEPISSSHGEVNQTFAVPEFETSENQSLFIWVFLPDEYLYAFSISLSNDGFEKITWSYANLAFISFITEECSYQRLKGWKLIELPIKTATLQLDGTELENLKFNKLSIKYEDELEIADRYSRNNLLFYNVCLADSLSFSANVIESPNYSNFKIKSSLTQKFKDVYVGDILNIENKKDVFEYVFVGRSNLNLNANNNYEWIVELSEGSNVIDEFDFGVPFEFDERGPYTINIIIKEYRSSDWIEVVRAELYTYCETFTLGGFSNARYELDYGETKQIYFSIADRFVFDGEVKVETSSGSIVRVESYEVVGNMCYMNIKGVGDGTAKIIVSATGRKSGDTKIEKFSSEVKVYVGKKPISDITMIILWVVFGIYVVGFAVFGVISFVRARKFSVK